MKSAFLKPSQCRRHSTCNQATCNQRLKLSSQLQAGRALRRENGPGWPDELANRVSDEAYSLTDCRSVNVIRKRGITDVLTHDTHFTQEGFHMREIRFQHLSRLDLSDGHMHVTYSTGGRPTKHWERIARKNDRDPHRITEQTFETVRLNEFAKMPSRRHCIFMFDLELDPDSYAESMNIFDPETYNVVEIEVRDAAANLFRADKSLMTRRIVDGTLTAEIADIASDARQYWSGYVKSDLNGEILLCGKYEFTRIIRPVEELVRPFLTNPDEILV